MKNKSKLQRFFKFIPSLGTDVFCVYLILVVVAFCTTAQLFTHYILRSYSVYNIIFIVLAALIALILIIIISKYRKKWKEKQNITKFIIISSIVLFMLQLFVVYGKFFIAGWDVNIMLLSNDVDSTYVSMYPNNLFLKCIYLLISKFIMAVPGLIDTFGDICNRLFPASEYLASLTEQRSADCICYIIAVVLNCALVNFSVVLIALIVNKLKGQKFAKVVYIFSALFVGLMPWILVPYSDTIALFFTTLILYFYICKKDRTVKWTGITTATIVGFNIKPTVIFCFVAIVIVEICKVIYEYNKKKKIRLKTYLRPIFCCVISCIICFGLINIIKNSHNLKIDSDKQFSITHYLMLGVNPDTLGYYSNDDVMLSINCSDIEDRESKNIEVFNERVNNFGIFGMIKHYAKKSILNYSDGTFMWALNDGPQFFKIQIGNNFIVNFIYDNFYYPAQVLWFIVLIGCICCLFIRKKNNYMNAIAITLLLLSLQIMILECGSRYLILYVSYFIVMSTFGWEWIYKIIQNKLFKNKKSFKVV